MEKSSELKNIAKEKEIARNNSNNKEPRGDKVNKTVGQRALVAINKLYTRLKKIYTKSHKFGIFLFSVALFIAGPYYIYHLNNRFINFIKINGGLRKEGGSGGMRPY